MDSTLVSHEPDISAEARGDRSSLLVPRADRSFLVRPHFQDALVLLDKNRIRLDEDVVVFGRSYRQLRTDIRRECLLAAQRFTQSFLPAERRPSEPTYSADQLIVASGHQPDLFHPGVWVKNIAVSEMASRRNAVGLNLIVDNDLVQSHSIRLPERSPSGAQDANAGFSWREIAYDDTATGVTPWEEVFVGNEKLFEQFATSVDRALAEWSVTPSISQHWQAVLELGPSHNLCRRLSAIRISLEHQLGLQNLELPMSEVCNTAGFNWFVFAVVSRMEEFVDAHNAALKAFRELNHIRSHTHPVPELAASKECFEAPFWVWSRDNPVRRPVFVGRDRDEIVLGTALDGSGEFARLPSCTTDFEQAEKVLRALSQSGVKIRTRALTTTMFARMFLCDLFVHGIGGARYDEMTDAIIRNFFGIEPGGFLTISYTAWLPFAEPFLNTAEDVHALKQRIRDLQQNPQRYLDREASPEIADLIAEKERLIDEQQATDRRTVKPQYWTGTQRYRRIPEINRALAIRTKPLIDDALVELERVKANLAANRFITNREISYCAFPEDRLRQMVAEVKAQFEPPTEQTKGVGVNE
jgi:hypothetical protein